MWPTNATSMAPPMPGGVLTSGNPVAKVVTAPLRVSTRRTRPAWPSVTYNAPSGPIVLPEPHVPVHPGAAKVASSVTAGACGGRLPAAAEGNAIVTTAMTTTAILDACLEPMTASFVVGGDAALRHRGATSRGAVARPSRSPTLLQTAHESQSLSPITDHPRHERFRFEAHAAVERVPCRLLLVAHCDSAAEPAIRPGWRDLTRLSPRPAPTRARSPRTRRHHGTARQL